MSDEFLSQEEIEALLAGVNGTPQQEQQDTAAAEEPAQAEISAEAAQPEPVQAEEPAENVQPEPMKAEPPAADATQQAPPQPAFTEEQNTAKSTGNIKTVNFAPLESPTDTGLANGVDLILDVQLQVSVELGKSMMKVKEVLSLGPGSVVELDKHAGEPVEVVVNNKVVARGEVVVIDENFGVRITEIVNAQRRDENANAA